MSKNPLIVFEGIETSGKSTSLKKAIKYLKKNKIKYISFREPGGTVFAEKIRNIFLEHKTLSLIATIFGIISGLLYVGVAFTPSDTPLDLFEDSVGDPWLHILVATWAFRFIVITAILYAIIIFKNENFDNKYAFGFIIFGLFVLLYVVYTWPPNGDTVYFLFDARPPEEIDLTVKVELDKYLLNLKKHVLAQKTVVFWMLISIYIYTLGLSKYILKKPY